MYYNHDYNHFQYFHAENYRDCADKIREIYGIFKTIEQAAEAPKSNS